MVAAAIMAARCQVEMAKRAKTSESEHAGGDAALRAFLDCLPEMIIVLGMDGIIVAANRATCEVLGYSEAEIVGKPLTFIHVPADHDRLTASLAGRRSGSTEPSRFTVLRKDGTTFPIESKAVRGEWCGREAIIGIGRNIAERLRDEARLHASEEVFAKAFHANTSAMTVTSVDDGRFLDVNDAFVRLTGYRREELIGRTAVSLGIYRYPAQRSHLQELITQTGMVREVEIVVCTRGGEERIVQFSGETITVGGETRLLGIGRDITDRKKAEAALLASDERVRVGLERTNIALAEHWPLENKSFHVRHWAELLGYSPSEIPAVDIKWNEHVHPDDRHHTREGIMNLIYGGADTVEHVTRQRAKSGEYHSFLTRACALERDHEGRATRVVTVLIDITDVKAVEDEARRTSGILSAVAFAAQRLMANPTLDENALAILQQLATATDASRGFIFHNHELTDGSPVVSLRHEWCAPGIPSAAGNPLVTNIPRDTSPLAYLGRVFDSGEAIFGHTHDFPPGARQFFAGLGMKSIVAVPIFVEGLRWGFIGFDDCRKPHDWSRAEIDALKAAAAVVGAALGREAIESDLRDAHQAANAAAQVKSLFIANMSHEIRTPLNAIIGMSGLLAETNLNDLQREYAEVVRASSEALLDIVTDILDFSKIEAGRLDFESEDFEIRACVEDSCDLIAQRAAGKGIEMVISIAPDVPERVKGDSGRLRQVLTNLLSNAVKFTDYGEVVLRVQPAADSSRQPSLRFEVRDTGIGIPAERLDQLFRAFSQVDSSLTRRFGGTGLGLAISKRIVEAMGGQIWCDSEPGRGSTFGFTCRFAAASPAADASAPPLGGRHVLIVDDNSVSRDALSDMLRGAGCTVETAPNSAAALDILVRADAETRPFDAAVIDCAMPGIPGEELGRLIKADPALSSIALVYLTSVPRRGDSQRIADAGFAAYLSKPAKKTQLLAALGTVVGASGDGPYRPLVTRHSIGEPERRALRILVVEDSRVNQKVIASMLRRLGCACDMAADGREALDLAGRIPYDLILMDCQMPEMDGLEATRRLRAREAACGHRPRIVALTALAMTGDRERCIEAGMDEYIPKPVQMEELRRVIDRSLSIETVAAAPPPPEGAQVDTVRLREATGGDPDTEHELVGLFFADSGDRMGIIRAALAERDYALARSNAHTLKGAAVSLGATQVASAAMRMEIAAAESDGARCGALFGELEAALADVRAYFRAHRAAGG
jgi:PAS domain S-box-containing protein